MSNIKITISAVRKGIIYESEGDNWEDIPEMIKTVKSLINKDINKEKNES